MTHETPRLAKATSIGLGLRRVVDALDARKVDPTPLLNRAGLVGLDLANRDLLVSSEAEARLIELAAQATGDTAFGIRMAEGADPRDAGLLYYLFNASATLRQALTLISRYIRVVNASLHMTVTSTTEGDVVAEVHYVGLSRRPLRHTVEYQLATVVRVMREIAGRPICPTKATFAHPRSAAIRDIERYFGCPVAFASPADRLSFSRETLDAPVLCADPRLMEILKPYIESMAARRLDLSASMRVSVENEIQKILPYGQARIDAIAQALGLSTRTLARRLAHEDTTFSDVLDGLRRALALEYLNEPTLSVDQITALLGYRDAGSFCHAVRRWTGASPTRVRGNASIRLKLAGEPKP